MALLGEIKPLLGIEETNTEFDNDIENMIAACKADLKISGVKKLDETDPLIERAIKMYCHIHFDYDEDYTERLQVSYNMLKDHLSLSSDYAEEQVI